MSELNSQGNFYIGRGFDSSAGKSTGKMQIYEADDLTTHAVVVGMTGSGKTGLCVGLLEEAALSEIPALLIDPKGDLTNILLHFPDLLPTDFQPWVNPDLARRNNQSLEEAARLEAEKWQKGLADWEIQPERIAALKGAVQFSIYTPGSDSGLPVSILASLKAPAIPWEENRELLREKISGTVVALLGLVGMQDIDPVRSREHILLANIFEMAWKEGRDLDLGELILQTQNPPFKKLGVFDVNTFYPERDRFDLAMQLNNILAAPSFQAWIEGQPLDIASLLYTPEGKPRHSVFYIAHLSDQERMFFVTLLYSAVEAWMRSQPGSPSLRALVYFDEIFGYLPPVSNPPSKPVIMRLLKQARAFGVGLVLATQNPADVDYKGLSNTGTWFIGKLQTDQDKQRLLDGLQGAVSGDFDRTHYDRLISSLGKRVFLLHNVNEKGPAVFQTRWAMNYLAGPLTRTQIPSLNRLAGTTGSPKTQPPKTGEPPSTTGIQAATSESQSVEIRQQASPEKRPAPTRFSSTRPILPSGVMEYYLPINLSFSKSFKAAGLTLPEQAQKEGLVYRPVLFAQSSTRFINRRYNLDLEVKRTALVPDPDPRGLVRWDDNLVENLAIDNLDRQPELDVRFAQLEVPLSDAKLIAAMKKDFLDWVYREGNVTVRANETLKIYAGPETSSAEFRSRCSEEARKQLDVEQGKLETIYKKSLSVIQQKLGREQRELESDQSELDQRKMEELGTHAENILNLFTGGHRSRRLSSSLSKRRQTANSQAEVKESKEVIADYQKQITALESDKARALQELQDRVANSVNDIEEITIAPMKKDILLEGFAVAWHPYYLARVGDEEIELPGFESAH